MMDNAVSEPPPILSAELRGRSSRRSGDRKRRRDTLRALADGGAAAKFRDRRWRAGEVVVDHQRRACLVAEVLADGAGGVRRDVEHRGGSDAEAATMMVCPIASYSLSVWTTWAMEERF